jgi:peptide/nickel transport system substrate-binding protein
MKLKNFFIKLRLRAKKFFIELKKTRLKDLRNSFFYQIKKIPDIVHLKNLAFFGAIVSVIILVLFVQRFSLLRDYFIVREAVQGGIYKHGVVGEADKINPLFLQNEAEESISKLVFSGLTTIVDGQAQPEVAEKWENPDATTYIFYIKDNVFWHDGQKLTVDDVVFTLNLIQNPDTRTPKNTIWKGVTYEIMPGNAIKFKLPNAYPGFLKVCSEPILPKHILEKVDPKNIKVAEYNQAPVGTGPYLFDRFDQVGANSEVVLKRNDNYYKKSRPLIDEVRVVFFENENDLVSSISRRQIDGTDSINGFTKVENISATVTQRIYLPAYTSVLFNYKSSILSQKDNRLAVIAALDRADILKSIDLEDSAIYGPLLPGSPGYNAKQRGQANNLALSKELIEKSGFKKNDGEYFTKDGKVFEIRFAFIDTDHGRKIATAVSEQLKKAGIKVSLEPYDAVNFNQNVVRPRNFDLVLIEQNVGLDSELYSFWHSSQISDPGQNLTGYKDRKIDKLLEQSRKSSDRTYIAERNTQIEQAIIDDGAAYYIYRDSAKTVFSDKVAVVKQNRVSRAIDVLNTIDNWYINFKEVVK